MGDREADSGGALWGSVYPLTTVVLRDLSPPAVVLARTAVSALVLIPAAAARHVLRPVMTRPVATAGAALLQATVPLVLLTTGQQHVPAALAGIVLATQPVWAAVFTWITDHTVRARELAGVLAGLAGIAVLYSRDLHLGAASGYGGLELLAAAASYAAGTVYIQRVIPDIPPLATAATMTVSAVALAPFAVATGIPLPAPATALALAVLAVAATGSALVLFYGLIHRVGAVRASLAGYLASPRLRGRLRRRAPRRAHPPAGRCRPGAHPRRNLPRRPIVMTFRQWELDCDAGLRGGCTGPWTVRPGAAATSTAAHLSASSLICAPDAPASGPRGPLARASCSRAARPCGLTDRQAPDDARQPGHPP
jgi:drug/metabolite transporter (DMT)-like permease